MAMFTKLLAIRMVANNFFGFAKSAAIVFPTEFLEFLASLISVGLREKKATSAPEINAETNE